ncbi:MAG TPA: sensor domain-containing diguanylate cyclase [Acidimicrobiales bacterium]|nr:sensor domain-containing diguanylate cyclase [Acidimicrobiales bacterium]
MHPALLVLVAVIAFAFGVAVALLSRTRSAARTPPAADEPAVDDSRFRQAIQRLGAAFAVRDREAIVDVILETAVLAVDAESAVLYVTPSATAPLRPRATQGVAEGDTGLGLDAGEGVAGRVAATDEPALHPGGAPGVPAPAQPGEPHGARTAAAVPIHSGGRLLGVVAVYDTRPGRRFTPSDLTTLATVVHQAETAIDNVILHEEAERLAITDGLTGVWNRRHLDLRANEEVRRAHRFGEPFSVVLLDVDDFKGVNDVYGHQAGDAVLVELAGRLIAAVREVDTVARYGGEEFCLLLPRTDAEGARLLAEKVRSEVAAMPFTIDPITGRQHPVTVSAGVATHPQDGETVTALLTAVDGALYRAKRAGKNRVEVAGPAQEVVSGGGS